MRAAIRQILLSKILDPFFRNVVLHLKGEGSTILDSSTSPKTIIATTGSTAISSLQSKYGDSSILFNGSSALRFDISATPINIRTDSWTFETWQRTTSDSDWSAFTSGNDFYFLRAVNNLYLGDAIVNPILTDWTSNLNTWEHLAVSFDGTTYRVFRNGILFTSSTTLLKNFNMTSVEIGGRSLTELFTNGYYDSMRITKDVCRYIGNFNPNVDTFMR